MFNDLVGVRGLVNFTKNLSPERLRPVRERQAAILENTKFRGNFGGAVRLTLRLWLVSGLKTNFYTSLGQLHPHYSTNTQ